MRPFGAMDPLLSFGGLFQRALTWGPVLVSSAAVALAVHVSAQNPVYAAILVALSLSAFLPSILARRRFRRLLRSGDPARISALWRRVPDETGAARAAEALMNAVTYAACGWVDEARAQLRQSGWDRVLDPTGEHRLFVETLLEAFDGDRSLALQHAARVAALPMPKVGGRLQRRVMALRVSLGALARAFAHVSVAGDLEILEQAARSSPLVTWAMRYAAAIVSVDRNEPVRALAMLNGAPAWPPQSAFQAFHRELMLHIAQNSTEVGKGQVSG